MSFSAADRREQSHACAAAPLRTAARYASVFETERRNAWSLSSGRPKAGPGGLLRPTAGPRVNDVPATRFNNIGSYTIGHADDLTRSAGPLAHRKFPLNPQGAEISLGMWIFT